MKLMALLIAMVSLAISGSAKAAQTQTCGMVVRIGSDSNKSMIVVKTLQETNVSGILDLAVLGVDAQRQLAANAHVLSLATTAINNPGSLDFCMKMDGNKIVSATITNRFKIK